MQVVADGTNQLEVLIDGERIPARLVDVRLGLGLVPDVNIEALFPRVDLEIRGAHIQIDAPRVRFVCQECGHVGVQAQVHTE